MCACVSVVQTCALPICLIFRILAAFDPDNRSARRHRKIDRSSAVGVVRFFALELQKIPSRGMTARACQARAKLGGQARLTSMRRPDGIISPAGKEDRKSTRLNSSH